MECRKCKSQKKESEFTKRKGNATKLCKECKSVIDKEYRTRNKEKISKYFFHKWREDSTRRQENKIYKETKRFGMNATDFVKDKKCESCGMTNDEHLKKYKRRLNINHKNNIGRNTKNPDNRLENFEILCQSCHTKYGKKKPYDKKTRSEKILKTKIDRGYFGRIMFNGSLVLVSEYAKLVGYTPTHIYTKIKNGELKLENARKTNN
jgi:hypothetical protein